MDCKFVFTSCVPTERTQDGQNLLPPDQLIKVIFEGFLLAESIERFFSFHFLVSQHHTSDVKSLGLVMLEEVKR